MHDAETRDVAIDSQQRTTAETPRAKTRIGTLVSVASCALAEAISSCGPDWLFYDMEHSALSIGDVQQMIQAASPRCQSFIRLESAEPVYVKRALDTGCSGIIVPQVNTSQEAERIVRAGRYPPLGERSVGLGRALGYGARLAEGVRDDNDRVEIFVLIEHAEAIANVREIAAVPGVDGLFVGQHDLSGSLGHPGDIDHPEVQAAIDAVLTVARAAGKPTGIYVGDGPGARVAAGRGFSLIAVGADISRLATETRRACAEARG